MFESHINFQELIGPATDAPRRYESFAYPSSPEHFGIIDVLETRVGLLSREIPHDARLLNDLYHIVGWADGELDRDLCEKMKLAGTVYDVLFDRRKVGEQQTRFFEILAGALNAQEGKEARVAFPMYGAMPLLHRMRDFIADDRLFPVIINGTQGMETGSAVVKGEIPAPLLNPSAAIVFADDVTDSAVTAIQLAIARRKERMNQIGSTKEDPGTYDNLIAQIQRLRTQEQDGYTRSELDRLYASAAILLMHENVVLAPLYNKNEPIVTALENLSRHLFETPWEILQRSALRGRVNVQGWIMGGKGNLSYPLLDTNVSGEAILPFVDEEYQETLKRMGFDRLFLRLGAGIRDLVVMKDGGYNMLVQAVAPLITEYMKYRKGI